MSKSNPRRANSSLRNALRARMKAKGLPCALCHRPIDYALPSRVRVQGKWVYNDWAFELDEIIPVSRWYEGGYATPEACALDPNNHQPAHRICNRMKGNKMQGKPSGGVGCTNKATKNKVNKRSKPLKHSQKW